MEIELEITDENDIVMSVPIEEKYYNDVRKDWYEQEQGYKNILLAKYKDNIIGFILFYESGNGIIQIFLLYITKEYRSKNVGKTMLKFLLESCPNARFLSRCENDASISLHQKCGFVKIVRSDLPKEMIAEYLMLDLFAFIKFNETITTLVY